MAQTTFVYKKMEEVKQTLTKILGRLTLQEKRVLTAHGF
jgi:hypothetical protein